MLEVFREKEGNQMILFVIHSSEFIIVTLYSAAVISAEIGGLKKDLVFPL